MAQATATVSVQVGGLSITSAVNRAADNAQIFDPTLSAAKAGQLTTRTDDETGELTMNGGHGITTASVIDIYWEGGARYDVTVGTVASNAVPIGADNSGTGDVLPTNLTNVTVMVQQTVSGAIDGDNLSLAALKAEYTSQSSTAKARVGFFDADDDLIASIELDANSVKHYDVAGGIANPFTGDPITYMKASHSDTSNTCQLKMGFLGDSTP